MAAHAAALRLRVVDDPPAGALLALAERLRRLSPSPRDPERFHEEKFEIEGELRRLALPSSPVTRSRP